MIDRNPDLHNYIVTIHYKNSSPPRTREYPLAQARDLFPALIVWHIFMTASTEIADPKLQWAVDLWRSITTVNVLENNQHDLIDLNMLSSLRTQVSYKKAKLSHLATELIVEVLSLIHI